MLAEVLHDRAVQYISGAMGAAERDDFDVLLAWRAELRAEVAALEAVVGRMALAERPTGPTPSVGLKSRLLAAIAREPAPNAPDAFVVTGPDGGVEWVNEAFTELCGYTLAELRGRKPGAMLQGAATDAAAVGRIRAAIAARRRCRETLANYHKDGSVYHADVRIAPILDDGGAPLYFVARERLAAAAD